MTVRGNKDVLGFCLAADQAIGSNGKGLIMINNSFHATHDQQTLESDPRPRPETTHEIVTAPPQSGMIACFMLQPRLGSNFKLR